LENGLSAPSWLTCQKEARRENTPQGGREIRIVSKRGERATAEPVIDAEGRPRMTRSISRWPLVALLLAFGSASWWIHLRPSVEVDPERIEAIPRQLGGWVGEDIPLSDGVERLLRADAQIQRGYRNEAGDRVWLYVGYYGTARGGRPEHTPWVCYPSAGWQILSSLQLPLSDRAGARDGSSMIELVVEQGEQRRLVHFWYSTHRTTAIATELGLTWDHLLGRVSPEGRADGALVRISTPIDKEGIEAARNRLRHVTGYVVDALQGHWPTAT